MFYIGLVCWKCKVKPGVLIKKLLPTFLIALSTSSSSAAFGTNIESCKALGIDKKLINFGVSIGQIIFMPAGAIQFFYCIPVYRSELWHRDNHRLDHNLHYNLYDSGNCSTANPRRRFILLYHFICTIRNLLCRNCISDQYRVTHGCIFNSLQSCISTNRTYTFCKKIKFAR